MFFGARYFGQRYFGPHYFGSNGGDVPPPSPPPPQVIPGGAYERFRRKSELRHVAKYAHLLARELEERVIEAVEEHAVTSRKSLKELLTELRREVAPKVQKADLTPIFRMIESSAIAALKQQEEDEDDLLLLAS